MEKKFITVKEAAIKLGLHVVTIYRLIKTGKIKGHRFNRSYRILKDDLDTFIMESRLD